jgi:hypothetical protein
MHFEIQIDCISLRRVYLDLQKVELAMRDTVTTFLAIFNAHI